MLGKSQTIRDFVFTDCLRFFWLMKILNHRHSWSSGMVREKSGKLGAFLFSWWVPDFHHGQQSFPTYENTKNAGAAAGEHWRSFRLVPSLSKPQKFKMANFSYEIADYLGFSWHTKPGLSLACCYLIRNNFADCYHDHQI